MGRKAMKTGKAMPAAGKVDIRLRVDDAMSRRIQAAADAEGNSVAAFVRAAVVRELKRREREEIE